VRLPYSPILGGNHRPTLAHYLFVVVVAVGCVVVMPPGLANSRGAPAPRPFAASVAAPEPLRYLERGGIGSPSAQVPSWINVTSGPTPPGDYGAAMAYDPLLNESVLFGGYLPPIGRFNEAPQQINATWGLQNGTWTNITSTVGLPPVGRLSPSLSYDARDGYLLLTAGSEISYPYNDTIACHAGWCNDTWKFAGGRWTQLPLPALNPFEGIALSNGTPVYWDGSVSAYDSTDGFLLVQSAFDSESIYGNTTQGRSWAYEGSNWTDLTLNATTNTTAISPNYQTPALIDDPAAGGVLLFGGSRFTSGGNWGVYPSNETWLFAHGAWTNVTANSTLAPPADGYGTPVVGTYDNATQSVIIYDPGDGPQAEGLIWEWKNFHWSNITPASRASYPSVFGPAIAWDANQNAAFLFGGIRLSNTNQYSNSTWEWTSRPPITRLSIAPSFSPVDPGIAVNFSVQSVGGVPPFAYSWSFGDGLTSVSANPFHTYGASGRYLVNLTLSDSLGQSRSSLTQVVVDTAPALAPVISPSPTDVGVTTKFSAGLSGGSSGSGAVVVWNFGDSSPPSSGGSGNNSTNNSSYPPSPPQTNHTYSAASNYTPQIWWNDSGGSRLTKVLTLAVNPILTAPRISAIPSDPYLGQLVNFTAKASGGTQPYRYSWQFGDGGTGGNLQNISHVYTTNGPFLAQVTVTDAAGAAVVGTENITTALNLSAFANVSFGAAPLPVGFGSHVSGGAPGYQFAWTFGDGGTSELSDPDHTYTAGGTYRATVVVTDQAGNAASNSWNVTVATGGGPVSVSLTAVAAEIPLGASDSIAATVTGGQGAYALRWTDVPAGCRESGLVELNCTPTSTGQFAVSLTVTDSRGVSGNATAAFAVGEEYGIHTGGPSQTAAGGIPASVAWGAVVAATLIAVAIGVVIGRRGRGGPPPPTGPDPKYADYRSPPPGGTPTVPVGSVDPVDDLF
jgi:PKD repeat protein